MPFQVLFPITILSHSRNSVHDYRYNQTDSFLLKSPSQKAKNTTDNNTQVGIGRQRKPISFRPFPIYQIIPRLTPTVDYFVYRMNSAHWN